MMGSGLARLMTACSSKCHRCPEPQPRVLPRHQPQLQREEPRRPRRLPQQQSHNLQRQSPHVQQAAVPLVPVPLENWRLTPPSQKEQQLQQKQHHRREPPTSPAASSIIQLMPDAEEHSGMEGVTINLRHRKRRPKLTTRRLEGCSRVRLKRATCGGTAEVIDSWPQVQLRLQHRRQEQSHQQQQHDRQQTKQTRRQRQHAFCCLPVSDWTRDWLSRSGDGISALASRFDCSLMELAPPSEGGEGDGCRFLEIWGPNVARVRQFHDRLLLLAANDEGLF